MGTWGTGLFADDVAADIRDAYRDTVGDGGSGEEATDALLREWTGQLADPDVGPVFWLALAATQWRCGRLEDRVRAKAIEVIETGADVRRWRDNPRDLARREAVLTKLLEQLRSPQPARKRIAKRFRNSSEWKPGEVIAYKLRSGNFALFRLVGFHTDRGGTGPVFELLDWLGTGVPSETTMSRLPLRERRHPDRPGTRNQFLIGRLRERDFPQDRVVRTGITLKPSQSPGGYAVFLWRDLDRMLEAEYGIG